MKMNAVWPGVFVRGRSDELPAEDKIAALAAKRVTRVVNLWSRPDPDLARHYGGNYQSYPIPDGDLHRANASVLQTVAIWAAAPARKGNAVLIQCHAGRNRSGLLAALVVRELTGKSGREALAAVREARPGAVDNRAFEAFLEALE
jgi:protein-tyrosine phosphatase